MPYGMKQRRSGVKPPSVGLPIAVASFAVALSIALLVGWTIIILQYSELSQRFAEHSWLLPTGIVAFSIILLTLVLGSIYLVRQMLEARRQVKFIDSVTHELKSPLASIRLGLETLARSGIADSQREQLRQMMLEDVERLNAFIERVLQASRLPVDRVGQEVDDIPMRAMVNDCVERVRRRYNTDRSCFHMQVPDDIVLRSDRTALEAVLTNLLDNAVKYSDAPPNIEVHARRSNGDVVIDVRDKGIGIPRAQLGRIFDRFHRVPTTEVSKRKGTGLGLYVVKGLVDQLDGHVQVDSEGTGKGTTMTVVLRSAT